MKDGCHISFDRSASQFILDAFPGIEKKCSSCGKDITADNLAGVLNEVGFICNDELCLVETAYCFLV